MNNVFHLEGTLNFANVTTLLPQGKKKIEVHSALAVNLHDVTHCDSAGLALLTAWVRYAKQRRTQLHFVQAPAQLQTIADVYGLKKFLPFKQ